MEKQKTIAIKEFALQQLEQEYYYYIDSYSLEYAESFRLHFFAEINNILPFYKTHPECRFLLTKNKIYRNVVWKNYLIVYKIQPQTIEVISLFHTKQNPSKIRRLKGKTT